MMGFGMGRFRCRGCRDACALGDSDRRGSDFVNEIKFDVYRLVPAIRPSTRLAVVRVGAGGRRPGRIGSTFRPSTPGFRRQRTCDPSLISILKTANSSQL
jgi:hypothetical protein